MTLIIGECDVCCRDQRELRRVTAYGIETMACDECLGDDPDNDLDRAADFASLCLWDELPGRRGAWDIPGVVWGESALIREWRFLIAGTEVNWWLTYFPGDACL